MKQAFHFSELSDLKYYARFEVITALSTKVTVARYVTILGQVEICRNFGQKAVFIVTVKHHQFTTYYMPQLLHPCSVY